MYEGLNAVFKCHSLTISIGKHLSYACWPFELALYDVGSSPLPIFLFLNLLIDYWWFFIDSGYNTAPLVFYLCHKYLFHAGLGFSLLNAFLSNFQTLPFSSGSFTWFFPAVNLRFLKIRLPLPPSTSFILIHFSSKCSLPLPAHSSEAGLRKSFPTEKCHAYFWFPFFLLVWFELLECFTLLTS